jgi:hypothetical protein
MKMYRGMEIKFHKFLTSTLDGDTLTIFSILLCHINRRPAGENHITKSFIICTLHQTIRIIKSRRVKWTGHLACMEGMRNAYFWEA